jgi:signal transduction histidine kinase
MLPISFRTRILLLVLAVAVVPLGLLGLWLTRSAARSGEELLRTRLDEALAETASQITTRWVQQRFDLLFLAEEASVHRALQAADGPPVPPALQQRFDELGPGVVMVTVLDREGEAIWMLTRAARADAGPPGPDGHLTALLSIRDRLSGQLLGTLEAGIQAEVLLPPGSITPAAAGMVIGLFESSTAVALLPLPFDPAVLAEHRFVWGGDEWLSVRRTFSEPPFDLVLAAPLTPFVQPFEDAARRGGWLLLVVAVVALAMAALLTGRMTRSLRRLSAAAAAVSRGDLEQRVEKPGADEVGQVARAFNTMTESLSRTLRELASRESLAAVGEFAASLAHEIRNPLTAIRVDLQSLEEKLPRESSLREPLESALTEIERLNLTVKDTLEVARRGRAGSELVDLSDPLSAAAHAARPAFEARGAILTVQAAPKVPVTVRGDAGALEQLFLNVIQNAAQALDSGGEALVRVDRDRESAVVAIRDDGAGIPPEDVERVFDPLFSTKEGGTGLGLTIARRIARAAGGEIHVESTGGTGTTVEIRLPLAAAPEGGPL